MAATSTAASAAMALVEEGNGGGNERSEWIGQGQRVVGLVFCRREAEQGPGAASSSGCGASNGGSVATATKKTTIF